jgi:hypothetical protein
MFKPHCNLEKITKLRVRVVAYLSDTVLGRAFKISGQHGTPKAQKNSLGMNFLAIFCRLFECFRVFREKYHKPKSTLKGTSMLKV